ncbi:hypothetical protein ACQBAU_15885 [Propionibacteriaceae bacterium Y2011]
MEDLRPSRRQVLGLAALGGTALTLGGLADSAVAARPVVQPTTYGPAILTAAMRGATRVGDKVYQTTRYLVDGEHLRIVEADLTTGEVTWVADVDVPGSGSGAGGLMMASDGTYAYVGMAGNASIFRLDPQTHAFEAWVEAGPAGAWWYDMAIAGDWLYLSSYPDCTVRRVHLTTKEVQTYGVVSESRYANSLAVTDSHVYGGANAPGGIKEWALDATGTDGRDITAYLGEGRTIPIKMAYSNGLLYIGTGKFVVSFDPTDGTQHVARPLLDSKDRYIDFMCVTADGAVYAIARTSGNIYRCDADQLVKVGQALEDDGQNNFLGEYEPGVLVGTGDSGRFWKMTLGEEPEVFSTVEDAGYPDRAQDLIRHSNGTIWVAGHGASQVHDLAAGSKVRVDNFGEIKALAEVGDGSVYGAIYPGCTITRFDQHTVERTDVATLTGQYRPALMSYDDRRNQLVVVSGPHIGGNQGAVSFVDLADHAVEVRTDYLPDQSVRGLHVVGDIAYVAGDTHGEGTGPVAPVAQIAAIDLNTRELLWRAEPRSDVASYERIIMRGGKLYLMARRPRGDLITYDPETEAVELVTNLGGYGGMDVKGRRLMTWVHWELEISHITPTDSVRALYSDVTNGWYNNPRFAFEPERDGTWGMYGLELAWFPFRA